MAEKNFNNVRIINKHDTEVNWLKATGFTPKQGELIVYDVDENYNYERIKIGDGVQNVNDLPFVDDSLRTELLEKIGSVDDKVDAISTLIGDKSVSEQINTAAVNNQSDWSVNDETSPAYVKNRPFYTTDVEKIQLYNGVITFQENVIVGTTVYIGMADQLVEYNAFKKGQEIQIIFDGVEYNLTLKQSNNTLYAGNGSIINVIYGSSEVDTGEAFCYIAGAGFVATTNEAEHVITTTVNHSEDIVIPHKYLGLNIGNGDADDSIVANDISNTASGDNSFAAGYQTTASGNASFAQGKETVASGDNSHAEGNMSEASSYNSHAEGNDTTASGHSSHSEGIRTEASGQGSHAEGSSTKASAWNSHSEGQGTEAASKSQHVFGEYNIVDKSSGVAERGKYIQIAGNGGSSNDKSNAYTLDWDGNAWFKGTVKVGGTGQDDETAKELATQEYVQSFLPKMTTITLSSSSWIGDSNPWSQVVSVNGVTANSKVDLQPTAVQIVSLQDSEITLMMQNDDGVVTAWAVGNKPTQDYEMQVLITEVVRV